MVAKKTTLKRKRPTLEEKKATALRTLVRDAKRWYKMMVTPSPPRVMSAPTHHLMRAVERYDALEAEAEKTG